MYLVSKFQPNPTILSFPTSSSCLPSWEGPPGALDLYWPALAPAKIKLTLFPRNFQAPEKSSESWNCVLSEGSNSSKLQAESQAERATGDRTGSWLMTGYLTR